MATAACVPYCKDPGGPEFHSIVYQLVFPPPPPPAQYSQHSASVCRCSPEAHSDTGASSRTVADVKQIPTVVLFAVLARPHT